jgi:hypothetical protein
MFPSKNENRQAACSHTLIQYVLEILPSTTRKEKEIKGIQIGKEEIKLFLF